MLSLGDLSNVNRQRTYQVETLLVTASAEFRAISSFVADGWFASIAALLPWMGATGRRRNGAADLVAAAGEHRRAKQARARLGADRLSALSRDTAQIPAGRLIGPLQSAYHLARRT